MSQETGPTARGPAVGLWVLIVVVLAPPIVLPLCVPLYDKQTPTLWGFPFFYWFQTALIVLAVVCVSIAYWLSRVADRRRREGAGR